MTTQRADLLALTPDDLAAISNRGTVKRVTRELDGDKVEATSLEVDEDGTLVATWSDGVTCTLHGDRGLQDADCTCPATNMCRHIIRSVLAYQRSREDEPQQEDVARAWDPGVMTDETIERALSGAALSKARKAEGGLVELRRGKKPMARFHELGHTLLFQVPEDLRYTRCDCTEDAPCSHVALAIEAFRALDPDRHTGFVTLGAADDAPVPTEPFEAARAAFVDLAFHGFAHSPAAALDRLHQLEVRTQEAGLTWHATLLHDLRSAHELYNEHDARFDATALPDWIGEFLLRAQALQSDQTELPRVFIQGPAHIERSTLGGARLLGLGCHVTALEKAAQLQAMFQDMRTGTLMAITTTFPDEEDTAPTFAELGARPVGKGRGLTALGASQLVLKKAHVSTSHALSPTWTSSSTYPQSFDWDQVLAPVRVEDFEELRASLLAAPPGALRPRVVGEDFHVVPVREALDPAFDPKTQAVVATLVDIHGAHATLRHPYTNRNRHGTERLLHWLRATSHRLAYVAGVMKLGPTGVRIEPTAAIFEDTSGTRMVVQPWVDAPEEHADTSQALGSARPPNDPVDIFRTELADALGEVFLLGLGHLDIQAHERFSHLLDFGLALGLRRLSLPLADLCSLLDRGDAEDEDLAHTLFSLCTLHVLMRELA